jgi:uncharacterized protein (DUF849 family)
MMISDGIFNTTLKGNDPEKAVITAALTGAMTTREHHPAVPYTPEEIAEDVSKVVEAGAAQVHLHARTTEGEQTFSEEVFQEIYDEVRDRSDVIINFATGARDIPLDARTPHLRKVQPEVAALSMGSMNFAKYSERKKEFVFQSPYINSFDEIRTFAQTMKKYGIKPELECFSIAQIANVRPLLSLEELTQPLHFGLILGVLGGTPATPANLINLVQQLPEDSTWHVNGIGSDQWPMVNMALSMGGNIRVGLEDNFYLPSGDQATDNAELVEKAAEMTRNVGREPASPSEAREILSIN